MTSRSHIPPVSNKAHGLWWEPIFYFVRRLWAMDGGCLNKSRWYDDMRGKGKANIFVLNSHNKLQILLVKNKIFLWKRKTTAFWQNTRHRETPVEKRCCRPLMIVLCAILQVDRQNTRWHLQIITCLYECCWLCRWWTVQWMECRWCRWRGLHWMTSSLTVRQKLCRTLY